MERILHFLNGGSSDLGSIRMGKVFDPATGENTKEVYLGGDREVSLAVDAASKAWVEWRESTLTQRSRILFAYKELLEKNANRLAKIITSEHGKVFSDAQGEVRRGIDVVDFACGIPHLLKGSLSEAVSREVDTYSSHQPLGVVAGITPFNFPAMVPMWMFPVAIACGNAFVLKPSERDPSTSMVLAELFSEAGLPDGVFNVIHGDKEAVDALLAEPRIRAVSFVGSTAIARYIYATAAANGKRVQALGGAKNHMVVLPDADLDAAADAAVSAGYGSAGERCMAISVLVAVGGVGDALRQKIEERIAVLKVGDGREPDSDMGPLVTQTHKEKVASYIGLDSEAEVVVDGRSHPLCEQSSGFFLGPTLLDRVSTDMAAYRDEIFGPVLSMMRVPDLSSAIELVNANPYANGTSIFTRDGGAARRYQRAIDAGMVGVNVSIPVPVSYYSFGGSKDSLFGDLHIYGEDGIRFYTRTKVVTSRWPSEDREGVEFGFPQNT